MFNDKLQIKLEKPLKKVFKKYDKNNINKQIYKDIIISYNQMFYKSDKIPLVKFKIYNKKIFFNKKLRDIYIREKDDRFIHIYSMLKNTIKWATKNNLEVPNTSMYFFISDRFPYHTKNIETVPFFIYSRPININIPIFPDNTFHCFNFYKKYQGDCIDWDITKNKINQYCDSYSKSDIIYFKGTKTTKRKYKLRENLEKFSLDKDYITVKLDAWINYEELYKLCKYLILLNLPGHYPWSNRLKYLYLTGSIVINVNINTISINPNDYFKDEKYISLIDNIFNEDSYIEIIYNYYYVSKINISEEEYKNLEKKRDKLQKKEFKEFTQKLFNIYNQIIINKDKYLQIAENNKIIANSITNERILQYIYKCIKYNSFFI